MSNVLKHRFTSPKLDGADLTQVQPSAWNDGHQFSGGLNGDILTRDTSDATFGATWATPAGWVPYTPLWWLGGTLVTSPGDHTFVSATYHRRGNAVWFAVLFQVGTAPLVAGAWQFGLPVPCTALLNPGFGMINSGAALYPLFLTSVGLSDRVTLLYLAATPAATVMSYTAPVVLTAGMVIEVRGNYQAA